MRKFLNIFLLVFCQFIFCQEDFSKYKPIEPLYNNGGIEKFYEYLSKNIDLSKVQNEKDIIIGFVLNNDGKMNHIKVSFCNNSEVKNELISVLQNADKWDLSNQKDKGFFILYKLKLFFDLKKVYGLTKTMWYKDDVQDINIDKNEFDKPKVATNGKDENGDNIYNSAGVEVKPEFPGGMSEFYKFIGKNYKSPNVPGLKGKIFISFIIEIDGSVSDIRVLKDIGYGSGEEAVRVLKECPKWRPAEQNGKKVRCCYNLPISIETPK